MENENNIEPQERGKICLKDVEDIIPRLLLASKDGDMVSHSDTEALLASLIEKAEQENRDLHVTEDDFREKEPQLFRIQIDNWEINIDMSGEDVVGIVGLQNDGDTGEVFLITYDLNEFLSIENIEKAEEKIAWLKRNLPFET